MILRVVQPRRRRRDPERQRDRLGGCPDPALHARLEPRARLVLLQREALEVRGDMTVMNRHHRLPDMQLFGGFSAAWVQGPGPGPLQHALSVERGTSNLASLLRQHDAAVDQPHEPRRPIFPDRLVYPVIPAYAVLLYQPQGAHFLRRQALLGVNLARCFWRWKVLGRHVAPRGWRTAHASDVAFHHLGSDPPNAISRYRLWMWIGSDVRHQPEGRVWQRRGPAGHPMMPMPFGVALTDLRHRAGPR